MKRCAMVFVVQAWVTSTAIACCAKVTPTQVLVPDVGTEASCWSADIEQGSSDAARKVDGVEKCDAAELYDEATTQTIADYQLGTYNVDLKAPTWIAGVNAEVAANYAAETVINSVSKWEMKKFELDDGLEHYVQNCRRDTPADKVIVAVYRGCRRVSQNANAKISAADVLNALKGKFGAVHQVGKPENFRAQGSASSEPSCNDPLAVLEIHWKSLDAICQDLGTQLSGKMLLERLRRRETGEHAGLQIMNVKPLVGGNTTQQQILLWNASETDIDTHDYCIADDVGHKTAIAQGTIRSGSLKMVVGEFDLKARADNRGNSENVSLRRAEAKPCTASDGWTPVDSYLYNANDIANDSWLYMKVTE